MKGRWDHWGECRWRGMIHLKTEWLNVSSCGIHSVENALRTVVKNSDFRASCVWVSYFLAVWFWASDLSDLIFTSLICKNRQNNNTYAVVKVSKGNECEAFNPLLGVVWRSHKCLLPLLFVKEKSRFNAIENFQSLENCDYRSFLFSGCRTCSIFLIWWK